MSSGNRGAWRGPVGSQRGCVPDLGETIQNQKGLLWLRVAFGKVMAEVA